MQLKHVYMAPIKLILMIHKLILLIDLIKIGIKRIKPYPPNLRRIAAKIIDPSIGASTCALGNHKWVKYIGIFTKNAIIVNIIKLNFIKVIDIKRNDGFLIKIILNNKGSEAKIV